MNDFSKTIKLPSTDFSMKANLSETEKKWIQFWEEKNIFKKLKNRNVNFKRYILHDGPPYANGDLHLGHALNKILKDIICRTKFQNSFDVHYIPGWDCHGLPIEWKVEEQFRKSGKKKDTVDLQLFRNECRKFAGLWVEKQKEQFNRFGIQNDWQEIYTTMTSDAEVTIVSELLKFLESGELYLGFKPVMWSVIEKTALAEAEIEYHEKVSKSIFVKFPIKDSIKDCSIVIWTTTPWTIPCNKAIAFSEKLKYKIVLVNKDYKSLNIKCGEKLIFAENLIDSFVNSHGIKDFKIIDDIDHSFLTKIKCFHPLNDLGFNSEIKIIPSSHVTDDSGSGFVHIAPNHGLEDFELGQKFGIKSSSTVGPDGLYTQNIPFFFGQHVFKADNIVLQKLGDLKSLISEKDYKHSYPHSWRSKAPLIFRATSQWFISMEKKKLRNKALKEIESVRWIPEASKKRIFSMVKERPDWCVSRQRCWGVPITVFLSKKESTPLIDKEVNSKIISQLKKEGIDSWFNSPNSNFLPEKFDSSEYEKEHSILDVWFDSGSSHVFVLKNNGINTKADLYIEGSDQHRGWFQSSLLESCAIYGKSPYKSVLTHGFVLDEKGRKMSKSLGNVISPNDVINKFGADILRMWVAGSNYHEDIRISFENLDRHAESYRKIRNTLRFLLGNLKNWDREETMKQKDLQNLEKYIRHKLFKINLQIKKNYDEFNFHKAFQIILSFCSQDLSSLFFDIRKDSLYCDSNTSILRRSARTVMFDTFECLVLWLSPIIPFTSEEAWQSWRNEIDKESPLSCHLLKNKDLPENWRDEKLEKKWEKIFDLRDAFSFSIEKKRNLKEIKSSLEAKVSLCIGDVAYLEILKDFDLSEIFIASEVNISSKLENDFDVFPENKDIAVKIEISQGSKCSRCWKVFSIKSQKELCIRCESVLNEEDEK